MWIAIANGIGTRQGVGGGVGPTPPPYTPPLDAYPADVAYSVRIVSSTYSGPCMEVYRVSDGATQDIGFDSFGRVSATELAAFSGGSVLEVQTWYDQMPGANHAVATTNSSSGTLTRAIIYNGSSIITDGLEPALDFVNPVDFPTLRFSNIGAASGYESFQVTNADTTNSGTPLYVTSTGYNFNHHQPISYPNGNVYEGFGSNSRPGILGIGYPNMYMQHVYNTTAGGGKNVRINNTLVATASAGANVGSLSHYISNMARTQVGDDPAGRYKGYIKELFIYKAIQTSGMRDVLTSNINSFYQIGNFPDYTSGFLADYPDAAAAYSVRKLSNTAIKCMRVRRFVPPYDEQDIGFTPAGDLDEAAIVAFGGSDVLVVSVWYDQSGQSRHATQDNPNTQPEIYNGTTVSQLNGKPCFSLASRSLNTTLNTVVTDANAFYCAGSISGGKYVLGATTGTGTFFAVAEDQSYTLAENNYTVTSYHVNGTQITAPTRDKLYEAILDQGVVAVDYSCTDSRNYKFGYGSAFDRVNMQEVVIYHTDQSIKRPNIETDINDYFEVTVNDEVATSGFLFDYPNADVAYSVRQLNDNAQFAMQVMRSDGRTKNIGFDSNGDLDTQAIIDFSGGGAVRVNRFYDQTGRQYHSNFLATATSNIFIYDGSSIVTENGKPMARYSLSSTGTSIYIDAGAATTLSVTHSIYTVGQRPSAPSAMNIFAGIGSSGITALYQERSGNLTYGPGWTSYGIYTYPTVTNAQRLYAYIRKNGTDGECFNDGVSRGTTTAMTATTQVRLTGWYMGKTQTAVEEDCNGLQELIAYPDDRTSVGDNTNILSNVKTYFSIP